MKKKMVVKVAMKGEKSRSKALKIVVGLSGVESASLKGDDKSQIEVTGVGVDAVKLTCKLRKGVGYAELVSVSAADKKDDKKDETKLPPPFYYYQCQPVPQCGYVENYGPSCSIL